MFAGPSAARGGWIDWREIGLWSAAGLVVASLHAGSAWYVQNYQPVDRGGDIAATVVIDMEPLPAPVVAEPVKEEVAPVEPQPVKLDPVPQEATAPEPVEDIQPEPEQVQPAEEAMKQPEPDMADAVTPEPEAVEEVVEETVELPKAEVPLPVVRPTPETPDVPKKRVAKKADPKPVQQKPTARAVDTQVTEAKQPPSVSSAASARQAERWSTRIQSYLTRRTRGARTAGKGTVSVRFVVTRDGNIISASVAGSSGSPQLDQTVVDAVRRASPVPSAPAEVAVSRQSFTVPFEIR